MGQPLFGNDRKKAVMRILSARVRALRFTMGRDTKELLVLTLGILPAWASYGTSDPLVFLPCLFISWIAFVCLCISHRRSWLWRSVVLAFITLFFCFIGYRLYERAQLNQRPSQYPWLSFEEFVDPGNTNSDTGEPSDVLKVNFHYKNYGSVTATNIRFRAELPGEREPVILDSPHVAVASGEERGLRVTVPKERAVQVFRAIQTDGSITKLDVTYSDLNGTDYRIVHRIKWNKEMGFLQPETEAKDGYPTLAKTPQGHR
jgi:hypothetical protein